MNDSNDVGVIVDEALSVGGEVSAPLLEEGQDTSTTTLIDYSDVLLHIDHTLYIIGVGIWVLVFYFAITGVLGKGWRH